MLFSPGAPEPNFEQKIDRLIHISKPESTPDGLGYFVIDASHPDAPTNVLGVSTPTPSGANVDILITSAIDDDVRPIIVDICITSLELMMDGLDREALLCEAGDRIIKDKNSDVAKRTLTVIRGSLDEYKREVREQDRQRRVQATSPLFRRQLGHSLGWLAGRRSMDDSGLERVEKLVEGIGLVPMLKDDDAVLRANVATEEGMVKASIYVAREVGDKHVCRSCTGHIFKGNTRLSLSLDRKVRGYDHHHYHPICFAETDMAKLDMTSARIDPAPDHLSYRSK